MEKKIDSTICFALMIVILMVLGDSSVNGMRLPNEEELETITNQINHQITDPDTSFTSIPNLHHQPDPQVKEVQTDSNSPTYSSPNPILNLDPNKQPRYHHDTDHLPTTSNRPSSSSDRLPSTSIVPSRPPGKLNIMNSKVIHSINSFDPDTNLHSLMPENSQLLREAETRLNLEIDKMETSFNRASMDTFRAAFFASWSIILNVMKLADVNKVGIPNEFLKKVIGPIVNYLIIRRNLPEILPHQVPGQTPVTRIVALWAKYWCLLVNTNPKPILDDSYVSGAMDWIIHLILGKLPINPLAVYKQSASDSTGIELRISRYIMALDQTNVLDGLTQELFDINLRNQVQHFYHGLVKNKQVPRAVFDYITAEPNGQYQGQIFNQYRQYRQDIIILRCALSGLRLSDHRSEWNQIIPIYSGAVRQTLRLLLIDRGITLLSQQLKTSLELKQPSFRYLYPFTTYLSESYSQVVKSDAMSSITSQSFDQITDIYLMPLRTWSTILQHMDPNIKVKLSEDMLNFFDEKVRQGIKPEIIHNWIYIVYFSFGKIKVSDEWEAAFIQREIKAWLSDQGRSISASYFVVEKLNLVSELVTHELQMSLHRHHQLLNLPPVPKFSTSRTGQGSQDSKVSRPSSSQPISKSSSLNQVPNLNLESVSKNLSPPSSSRQEENLPPVPKFSKPNLESTSRDLHTAQPSSSHQHTDNLPPVPKFNSPSNPGVSLEDLNVSPPSTSHRVNEELPAVPKFNNPSNVGGSSEALHNSPPSSTPQMNEEILPIPRFENPSNLRTSSEDSHIRPSINYHQFIGTSTPSSSSSRAVPRYPESSLEDFFKPKDESKSRIAQEMNEDEEREIDGFFNDYDPPQSRLENLMSPPSKRRRLDE